MDAYFLNIFSKPKQSNIIIKAANISDVSKTSISSITWVSSWNTVFYNRDCVSPPFLTTVVLFF